MLRHAMNVLRCAFKKFKKDNIQEEITTKIEYSAIEQDLTENLFPHVIDVFQALGNYDVRFEFDPFTIDDCRCNIASPREVSVLCSLKHVPLQFLIIEDDSQNRGVKLKLKDDFTQNFDGVCWEDFFGTTSEDRYFDSTKVHEYLSKAIRDAVHEVCADMVNVFVRILESSKVISLLFQLSEDSIYRVNLHPSIRVNSSCENFQLLFERLPSLPRKVLDECYFQHGIHVVAIVNTNCKDQNELWKITFNDIKKRLVLSETFECAKDCFNYINGTFKSLPHGVESTRFSSYHIEAVVLKEIFLKPSSKDWKEKHLPKRILGVQRSLDACLQKGICIDVFTRVNLFEGMSQGTLDEIAKFVQSFY